jgi:phenylacetyl-CoA:acceptor oxidoreductase 27-kDa subunit
MSCMHCANPPCLEVCPTRATYQTEEGIVGIDHDLCLGCAACVLACPYGARSINYTSRMSCFEIIDDSEENRIEINDRVGICSKCDFCQTVIETGLKKGLQPGRDPEATPKCVRYCVGEALIFGDSDDPESEISKNLRQNKAVRLFEESGTKPQVYYIPDNETK